MKRGYKNCPECNELNGARKYECDHCGFIFKVRPIDPNTNFKWYELNKGDQIKVLQGSGPYYINDRGERVYISDSGPYIVESIDEFGIKAFGVGKNNHGFSYIYMGPDCKSPIVPSVTRSAHKIIKIQHKRNDISFFMSNR